MPTTRIPMLSGSSCGIYAWVTPAKYGWDERFKPARKTRWAKCKGCGRRKDFWVERKNGACVTRRGNV